ncbi:MAG: DUF4238 domain-containing protein, partial [Pseudolysinimonas sp.]
MTKRRRRRTGPWYDPRFDIDAVFAAAQAMTDAGREPRRHHVVPRFYLDRWAESGRVKVVDTNGSRAPFVTSTANAGVETDFYRIDPRRFADGVSPVVWETWLSAIEGAAKPVFARLDSSDGRMSVEDQGLLLGFLGIQASRSRASRRRMRNHMADGYTALIRSMPDDEFIALMRKAGFDGDGPAVTEQRERLLKRYADPDRPFFTREEELRLSGKSAESITLALSTRKLAVYNTARRIVTSDEPVIELQEHMGEYPPRSRGAGYMGAPFLAFPLGPQSVLLLIRGDLPVLVPTGSTLSVIETHDLNRVIAGNAERQIFSSPSDARADKLYVPPGKWQGNATVAHSRDSTESLIHLWNPKRWHGDPLAPVRPIERLSPE